MTNKTPHLILLPNLLDEEEKHFENYLPKSVEYWVRQLDGIIAESEKGGRYFLRRFSYPEGRTFRDIPIKLLNEHTPDAELSALLEPVLQGQIWGLVSDAGLPCVADPGAKLVYLARKKQVAIEACVGPSSIFLALLLSGLSAQKFCFQGYLAKQPAEVQAQLKELQRVSLKDNCTQVFIETPYRSQSLLEQLLTSLDDKMKLCLAVDLTKASQYVMTKTVKEWKQSPRPDIQKKLVVFVFSG